jgi:hypothetical protein
LVKTQEQLIVLQNFHVLFEVLHQIIITHKSTENEVIAITETT